MKDLFKFFPVAVGLIALASCNSEDFFGGDYTVKKATLEVTVEDMGDGTTRTAYTAKNKRSWQETDYFTVYDNELHKYDYYKYNATNDAFELDGQKDLTAPAFVAFPKEAVVTTYWEKDTRSTSLDMGIPAEWDFAELALEDGTAAYLSQLPMWGKAEADGESIKAKDVQFLTSYIKITIDNALNNVKAVKIEAWEDIAGTIQKNIAGIANAVLSENGEVKSVTQLATPEKESTEFPKGNTITVNLQDNSGLTSDKYVKTGTSCIFIPLIAGHYGKVVASYQDNNGAWKTLKTWTDQTFERGGLPYGASKNDLKASGKDIPQLNAAITAVASKAGDVNVIVDDAATDVTGTTVDTENFKNNIVLPAMACDKLILDIPSFTGSAASQELWLTGDAFTKTVVLNPANFTNITAVHVNLPKGNVVLAGTYTTAIPEFIAANSITFGDGTTISTFGNQNFTTEIIGAPIENGASFIVENNATIGNFSCIAECGNVEVKEGGTVGTITYAVNHRANKLTVAGTSDNITIYASVLDAAKTTDIVVSGTSGYINTNVSGEAATNVTVSGTSGYIYLKGAKNTGNVVVSGECTSAITLMGTGNVTLTGIAKSIVNTNSDDAGNITINGKPNYTNTHTYAKVETIETKGNVTVALDNEGAAVMNSLTFKADAQLNLTQGYIKSIVVDGGTVTLNNGTDAAYTAIGGITLTTSGTDHLYISNKSVWNNKKIGESTFPTDVASADKTAAITSWSNYLSANDILTATEFAQKLSGAASLSSYQNVCADIDLNNGDAFVPVTELSKSFSGVKTYRNDNKFPTISNFKFAATTSGSSLGTTNSQYGFFCKAVGNAKIQNLTFAGIDIDVTKGSGAALPGTAVGGLIGQVATTTTDDVLISNVTVTNADINATGLSAKIGGVVGEVAANSQTGALKLTDVTVTAPKIAGYKALGGLIGYINNTGKVQLIKGGTSSAPTYCVADNAEFTQNTNSAFSSSDPHLAMVGSLIGSTDNETAANVAVDVAAANAPTYTVSNASTINPLAKWSVADGVGTKMVDIVKLPIIGLTGTIELNKTNCETSDKYKVNITVGTASAAEFKNKGTVANSSIVQESTLTSKKVLNFFKNF